MTCKSEPTEFSWNISFISFSQEKSHTRVLTLGNIGMITVSVVGRDQKLSGERQWWVKVK